MRALRIVVGVVAAFEMPVPLYWLVLHTRIRFWRRHVRAGYWTAVVVAWGVGGWLLYHFRTPLFHGDRITPGAPQPLATVIGLGLILIEVVVLTSVESHLGGRRLVGHAELTERGELATHGLYTRVRHPRYLGMMSAVLGCCVLTGSLWLWIVGAAWLLLVAANIRVEERELRRRFGSAYEEYARRVPALCPFSRRKAAQ